MDSIPVSPPAPPAADFDYIIVGSGAGGGPLAARLAQNDKRVLLLDAGDNLLERDPTDGAREVTQVPAFHGPSSEHAALSWQYFVDHYDPTKPPPAGADPKWQSGPGRSPELTGIFYPRSSGLGGCTVHNAMITIAGPDSDWDDLADLLRDPSWSADQMRPFFQKIERNQYMPLPPAPPSTYLGQRWDDLRWLFGKENDLTGGRHGFEGWLRTSVADVSIGLKDLKLIWMLRSAFKGAEHAGTVHLVTILKNVIRGRVTQILDPNHSKTQAENPEGLALIPLAVCGQNGPDAADGTPSRHRRGHRSSPREYLLDVQEQNPDRLVIKTQCFVTKILFAPGTPLTAVGVEVARGAKLYHACPDFGPPPAAREEFRVKAGGEVILCGGAFNSPQLLMLSGIGPAAELAAVGVTCRVDSPGVGKNLQDRYEVGVVSQMEGDFSLLNGATLALPNRPDNPDAFLNQWRQQGTGLYSSNGAVLGILKRSNPTLPQPDLFVFGLPFSFRGYAPGYSAAPAHNYFTWAILKAHTSNRGGTVTLRSDDPFATPVINFNYFPGPPQPPGVASRPQDDTDLIAMVEGVKFARSIGRDARWVVKGENYPGAPVPNTDDEIKRWVQQVAWGHHACGTCRLGTPDDPNAVLDHRFRVLGETNGGGARPVVHGLRVVDASIFPKIPGIFIVTNIYMASEKAAAVILADAAARAAHKPVAVLEDRTYPDALRTLEAAAIKQRRSQVKAPARPFASSILRPDGSWAPDVTGLAISGGGVRSATFSLGAVQALARTALLRRIDFMSTVSGGGYTGACIGRSFDRHRVDPVTLGKPTAAGQAPDRVEAELSNLHSPLMQWLRKHANFIAPNGNGDQRTDLAIFLRNWFTVHFCIAALFCCLFGVANWIRYWLFDQVLAAQGLLLPADKLPISHLVERGLGVFWSPWFVLVELTLLFFVFPKVVGYWLASEKEPERFDPIALSIVFLLIAVLCAVGLYHGILPEPLFLAASLVAGFFSVIFAWRRGRRREDAVGSGDAQSQRARTRVYLTEDLGLWLAVAGAVGVFALIDTAGHALQQVAGANGAYLAAFSRISAGLIVLIPVVRGIASFLATPPTPGTPPSTIARILRHEVVGAVMAGIFFLVPLILYSFTSHALYDGGNAIGVGVAATALAAALTWLLAKRQALSFVNRSSLAQTYAARISSTYLGASNPERQHPAGSDVTEVIPGDDVSAISDYRPHEAGGPFHLINATVNQTIDFNSRRGNRDRRGESLAVSCLGLSIGQQCHSLFPAAAAAAGLKPLASFGGTPAAEPEPPGEEGETTPLVPVGYVNGADHPLVTETGASATSAEMLSLRQWIGISGAAIGPARGVGTGLSNSLIWGLANLRTGYWWDSGINDSLRSGFPNLGFLRRLLYLLPRWLVTQSLILSEWVGRFSGPWERFWQLSDGGFFENTGAYELIRRRLPKIVLLDAAADPTYDFAAIADLQRKVRIDFRAEMTPLSPAAYAAAVPPAAQAVIGRTLNQLMPVLAANGSIATPSEKHGIVYEVTYADGTTGRLLYLKATTTGDETEDILNYQTQHPEFPNEGTEDQFFNEPQWESYRRLGEHIGADLNWFI